MLNFDREVPDEPEAPEPPLVEEPEWMVEERLEYIEWAAENTES